MIVERLRPIPEEEIGRLQEEAFEVNRLVDELKEQEKEISAQEAAERVIQERKISDLDKEKFAKGWGERMMREVLAQHPAVVKIEEAPKETDEQRKTDAFLTFERGVIGVQLTLVGFEERGSNDLKSKFGAITKRKTVTYRGQEDVPLTMIRSSEQKFLNAFAVWNSKDREGSVIRDLPQKERLANEFLRTMAMVFEHKYNIKHNPEDKEWSEYLSDIYQKREAELKLKQKSSANN